MTTTRFVAGQQLGHQLCEALGLDSMYITKIIVEMDADGPTTIIVTARVKDERLDEFVEEVSRYRLVSDE